MKLSERAVAIATPFTLAGALLLAAATSPAQVESQPAQQTPDSVVAVVADAMSLPYVPPDQRPVFGTFWEVHSTLPCLGAPLPCPPFDTNAPVYSIGDPIVGGQFLVDQTAGLVISPQALSRRRALSSMTTASILQAQVEELQTFVAGVQTRQAEAVLRANGLMDPLSLDGGGVFGPMGLDSYTTNDLWLEIISVTNSYANFTIHTPDTAAYDLFGTTNLSADVPGLNLTNWVWLLRTEVGQTNVVLTNLWADTGFFRLGTMLDSDSDGLTDAYELLVSHTNPQNSDTDGDGMLDGWEVLWGLDPRINNVGQASQRLNYTYDPAGWLGQISGVLGETITLDAEGNITSSH